MRIQRTEKIKITIYRYFEFSCSGGSLCLLNKIFRIISVILFLYPVSFIYSGDSFKGAIFLATKDGMRTLTVRQKKTLCSHLAQVFYKVHKD